MKSVALLSNGYRSIASLYSSPRVTSTALTASVLPLLPSGKSINSPSATTLFFCRHSHMASATTVVLAKDTNQAIGIGQYAIDFLNGKYESKLDASTYAKVKLFHTDSVICGISALALKTNAPTILRNEALNYPDEGGACVFGSTKRCATEKAIVANASAVREWDSNGTVFGYNTDLPDHQAGEFGHNDFYPVVVAAAQSMKSINGKKALDAMVCIDEIRGRLCEVFSLKTYKIDHVLHGAIASAAVYGALMGATAVQIESAVGMVVAHYVPYRAIRAGKQLSDSKGASAALSTEMAILSVKRAMQGFQGPKDIFRNPESIFCWPTKPPAGQSPFDLVLTHSGSNFAVNGMHYKLGLYEHQSAAALEGLIQLLCNHPDIYKQPENIQGITVVAYEPAFGIIGDPAKRDPKTRQSADHSMVYIVSTLLRKAIEKKALSLSPDAVWCELMLSPHDYSQDALFNSSTRTLMSKVTFEHGGPKYDALYPDGIPTTVNVTMASGETYTSGLVMYPTGHARNTTADLASILHHKFHLLGTIALEEDACEVLIKKLESLEAASPEDMQTLYNFPPLKANEPID